MASDLLPGTQELKDKLELIGFTIKDHGCDFYRIYNQHGHKTRFELNDDRVKILPQLFGTKGGGTVYFNLRECQIEYDKQHHMVSILAVGKGGVFISFYGRKR